MLINHTLNQRVDGIEVGAIAVAPDAVIEPVPSPPTTDAQALLTSVGDGSPLSVENSRAFLPVLFQMANAKLVRDTFELLWPVIQEAEDWLDGVANSRFVTQSAEGSKTTLTCPGGGYYVLDKISDDNFYNLFQFCQIDGATLNGDVRSAQSNVSGYVERDLSTDTSRDSSTSQPLTYTYASGVTIEISAGGDNFLGTRDLVLAYGADVTVKQGDKSLKFLKQDCGVPGARKDICDLQYQSQVENKNSFYSSFSTEFTVSGTLTNGRVIDVVTQDPFTNIASGEFWSGNYSVGLLVAKDRSGGQMSITADAAANGFIVRVDTDGKTAQFTEQWSDMLNLIKAPQ